MRKPGNPRLAEQRNSDTTNATLARQQAADEFAIRHLRLILRLRARGMSNREQAEWLNARGYQTRNKKAWHGRAVARFWERVKARNLRPPQKGFMVSADDISNPY